jgi:large conductance mechanosensitive channel
MQAVAVVFGTPDFSELTVTLNDATIRYGAFINAAITFLILAVTMFAVVKGYNALRRSSDDVDAGPDELELLTEIRDALRDRR